jgi:hypothetical protein
MNNGIFKEKRLTYHATMHKMDWAVLDFITHDAWEVSFLKHYRVTNNDLAAVNLMHLSFADFITSI